MTITYEDILDLYGTLNDLGVPDGLSGDRRTLSTTDAISAVMERAFTPDVLDGKGLFNGIVMATLPTTQPTFLSFKDNINYLNSIEQNPDGELQELHFIYKVYIPEIDPREIILNTSRKKACEGLSLSQRVTTLPTAVIGSGFSEDKSQQAIVPGTLVDIRFSDAKRFLRPIIVGIGGKVFDIDYESESLKTKFGGSSSVILRSEFGKITIQNPRFSPVDVLYYEKEAGGIYEPRTQKAVDLLTGALRSLNLPEEWAMLESLHYILEAESGGKVGVPNYRYDFLPEREPQRISGVRFKPETWKVIWEFAKKGKTGMAGLPSDAPRKDGSTSTGLGQLNKKNVEAYYPYGTDGIGDAEAEAYGFVNYIAQRYGDPDTARSVYNQIGYYKVGDYFWVPAERRNKEFLKDYKEGY